MKRSISRKKPTLATALIAALISLSAADRAGNSPFPLSLSFAQAQAQERPVAAEAAPRKIVIFYSSIGMGHLAAARAIKARIEKEDPQAQVVLKNIRDFILPRFLEKLDEKGYWFLVKNFPDRFDAMFRAKMQKGNEARQLADLGTDYRGSALLEYLKAEKPTAVMATHYGSAEALTALRQDPQIQNTPIGWLHTDYFEGYFPRISKGVDQTFLPHPELERSWAASGVDPHRFITTGMPLAPVFFQPIDVEAFMTSEKLDPKIPLFTIFAGGEGVGNFHEIIRQISSESKGRPVQIAAVTAKNEKLRAELELLKAKLPVNVHLTNYGFVKPEIVAGLAKSSTVYVTKSGGLSPTEAFATGVPTVLLDIYGGHEHDNAELFKRLKMAWVNQKYTRIGEQIWALAEDQKSRAEMLEAQTAFRRSLDIQPVVDFLLNPKLASPATPGLGTEGGPVVQKAAEALAALDRASPADIEIILSHPGVTVPGRKLLLTTENPFGHLAVRIRHGGVDRVFTANHLAKRGVDAKLLHDPSTEDFFYGTKRDYAKQEFTSSFGIAYGRDSISLRVSGLSPASLQAMLDKVAEIEKGFQNGTYAWNLKENNCADISEQILRAGGIDIPTEKQLGRAYAMPLEIFDKYRERLAKDPALRLELVNYPRVASSQSDRNVTWPSLSPYSVSRSLSALRAQNQAPVFDTRESTKRIGSYPGNGQLYFENVDGHSHDQDRQRLADQVETQAGLHEKFKAREAELIAAEARLQASAHSLSAVRAKLDATAAKLSPLSVDAVYRGDLHTILDTKTRTEVEDTLAYLRQVNTHYRTHLGEVDTHVNQTLNYLVERGQLMAEFGILGMKARIPHAAWLELDREWQALRADAASIGPLQALHGTAGDYQRIDAYRGYFWRLSALAQKIERHAGTAAAPSRDWIRGFAQSLRRVLERVKVLISVAPHAANLLADLVFRDNSRQVSIEESRRIVPKVNRLFRELGKALDYKLEVSGRENLPPASGREKIINVYAPTHRNAILDGIIMSDIAPDKSLLALAPKLFVPTAPAPMVTRKMEAAPGLIVVGNGRDKPIQSVLNQIKAGGGTQNLFIYPEGSTAVMDEVRPPRSKFSTGLLRALSDEGYLINLIPITFLDSGRLLESNEITAVRRPEPDQSTLRVQIEKPFTPSQVKLMLAADAELPNLMLRESWNQSLPTHETRIFGSPRIAELEKEVDRAVLGPHADRSFCVRSQLQLLRKSVLR